VSKGKSISFTISENERDLIEDLAKMQEFVNASAMARYTLFQYIERYSLIEKRKAKTAKFEADLPK